ncbi:MAG TPA: hypothetical protein VG713_00795, partial [Pirellulales bacterium]|nr:hypothetical protein [Pirellulales bacterium]
NNAQVTWEELPNEYSVAWSLGPPAPLVASGTVSADVEEAPRWFAKMDRNGDGDISPREFLGRSADFERLDVNGDRLISPAEAAAAAAD